VHREAKVECSVDGFDGAFDGCGVMQKVLRWEKDNALASGSGFFCVHIRCSQKAAMWMKCGMCAIGVMRGVCASRVVLDVCVFPI
jgi:hypothetical protein